MRDEVFNISLQLKDPTMETPEIRQYLDSCAAIIMERPGFQEKLRQARDEFMAFGTTKIQVPS